MSTPIVPPRPSRNTATAPADNTPQVPIRPLRKLDPSPSRSPFNELPNAWGVIGKKSSQNGVQAEAPQRPPNITLPSVGQEGSEYASYDLLPPEAHGVRTGAVQAPEQMRNVSANMPLHAPIASVPQSTAKSRISTVTRTDSTQAAAAGIGTAKPDDDVHKASPEPTALLAPSKGDDLRRVASAEPTPLRQMTSFNRSTPTLQHSSSKPASVHEGNHDHGIPEIGRQIPLYPMAGDVQAPSPAATQSQFMPGIGYFNDGSTRAHNRKRSSRQEFGPPDVYGLHTHGQEPSDKFERDWVARNPDKARLEGYNSYDLSRPATALTSEQLNKLVNQSYDIGMGTDPNVIGTPGEEAAWEATEEYVSKSQRPSPQPSPVPTTERKKRSSSGTQPVAMSPLRKTSFPFNDRKRSEDAVEMEDGGVIHIDPPERRTSKHTGGGAVDGTLDLGPQGGNTEERGGWFDERGPGTPILASDEILKRPGSAYMQPAVDPEAEPHSDDYYESDHARSRRSSMRVPSRPSSRPNSMHVNYEGGNLHRFISHEEHYGSGMHTPLEEIEEYEPLIPEGEEEEPKPKPKVKKRPGLEHHHFPSQDIWEDAPSSVYYSTTVGTPEPSREPEAADTSPTKPSVAFETPEQEQERKDENPNDLSSDNKTLINKPHLVAEMRPGMQRRFPSQDIWEDAPDSVHYMTTVSGPQMDEAKSPPDDRPTTTAIPASQDDSDARATTGFTSVMRPSIPSRPHRKSKLAEEIKAEEASARDASDSSNKEPPSPEKTKAPAIPDRPKPTVPARPARTSRGEQANGSELTKSISAEDHASSEKTAAPSVPKSKPVVPARPGGEKIAALKSGFMNDLNNRLKLGPQISPPKAKETEPEVAEETTRAPLEDARKSRAKGPARRKPAASPSAAAVEEKQPTLSISSPLTLWQIDENDELHVNSTEAAAVDPAADNAELEKQLSMNVTFNTTHPTLAEPMSPEKAESMLAQPAEDFAAEAAQAKQSTELANAEELEVPEPDSKNIEIDPEQPSTSAEVEKKELAPAAAPEGESEEEKTVVEKAPAELIPPDGEVPA